MTALDSVVEKAKAPLHDVTGGQDRVEDAVRCKVETWHKDAADAMAADTTAERAIFRVPAHMTDGLVVKGVYFTVAANVTAHATNSATLTVNKRDGAGGAATKVAEVVILTGTTGNLTAFVPLALTNEALANRTLAAGNVLTFAIAKSTGVVIPIGQLDVVYEEA